MRTASEETLSRLEQALRERIVADEGIQIARGAFIAVLSQRSDELRAFTASNANRSKLTVLAISDEHAAHIAMSCGLARSVARIGVTLRNMSTDARERRFRTRHEQLDNKIDELIAAGSPGCVVRRSDSIVLVAPGGRA